MKGAAMRKSLLILPATALMVLALAPAADAAEEQNNRFHAGMTYVDPNGNPKLDVEVAPGVVEHARAEIDKDTGFYADYERMIASKLGLKFGANWNKYDIDISGGDRSGHFGELKATPLYANLLFHPAPLSHTDFYIGGGFAYVLYSDVTIENDFGPGGRKVLDVDDDQTWNAQLGVDFRFGDSPFGLNIDAKYIKTSGDSELGALDVEPLT